jgi:hypothetical protein
LSSITTVAAVESSTGSTFFTLPASTPAMRTGELGWTLFEFSKVALSSNGPVKGTFRKNAK